jgi:hypothetical protein
MVCKKDEEKKLGLKGDTHDLNVIDIKTIEIS